MIESLLCNHLKQNRESLNVLATYRNELAVFNQEAPDDMDDGWEGTQYGRIVFAVDLSGDPERQISGTLAVDLYFENNGEQLPEDYEPVVRGLIDGYFFTTVEETISAQWRASNYFTEAGSKVVGVTITFDLLAFPNQETGVEMDPIPLLNKWTKEALAIDLNRQIKVINYSEIGNVWKPTDESPAIYWRVVSINPCSYLPDTYHCIWKTATIQCNIIAESKEVMILIARYIDNVLTMNKRLIYDDNSPFMIDSIRISATSDPMSAGQLTLNGTYGVLRKYSKADRINNIFVDGR